MAKFIEVKTVQGNHLIGVDWISGVLPLQDNHCQVDLGTTKSIYVEECYLDIASKIRAASVIITRAEPYKGEKILPDSITSVSALHVDEVVMPVLQQGQYYYIDRKATSLDLDQCPGIHRTHPVTYLGVNERAGREAFIKYDLKFGDQGLGYIDPKYLVLSK